MIGKSLAHYRITAALGAGGMGEVYRATDTRLGRDVALKVLPADMAGSPERLERFRREAKALAALDHPGIVTVFSVEEADGLPFLTMQLVEGESLERLIPPGGMPVAEILRIATGLADALAAAHDKGVVHRDLKPANIMVTDAGGVKILDFGLAKMSPSDAPAGSQLATEAYTREGVVMGTVPYMSPEQVAGRPLDHRTDLFSLGVILYEMATGQRPFKAHSSAELASAILRDEPAWPSELRDDLPAGLAQLISLCLAKNSADRLPSARAVRQALGRLGAKPATGSLGVTPAAPPAAAAAAPVSTAARLHEGFWVAVLPFRATGASAELPALAEGLTEEIVTALSRFSYLKVIARSSTSRFASGPIDVREVSREIGARYVMEGGLRQAGSKLRVSVQLVDATTGAHLWAETYDREFRPDDLFALQDEVVPRIVSTVADMNGVLSRSMSAAVRSRRADELTPYEAVLRSFAYFERVTKEELDAGRRALEHAVRTSPEDTDAWAMLALLCAQDYGQGFGVFADPLERGAAAARRAVETGPASHLAYFSLAQVLFFQRQTAALRNAAERAVALNPLDGNTIAFLGELLTYAGETERGLELAARAKQLNPNHPGWYWYVDFYDAYGRGDDHAALDFSLKANLPGHWGFNAAVAVSAAQLGDHDLAARALARLLEIRPDFAVVAEREFSKWWGANFIERMQHGLRKAGLELPTLPAASGQAAAATKVGSAPDSGAARAEEGFWVAVLPFRHTGSGADIEALAEGMTEEIVTGLSRFSYLRVVSRSATLRYAGATVQGSEVGREIGARYVMEGSVRQAGGQLRVAVQLVDAKTGANLWAETYTRPFSADQVFALQDDLVPRIVSTCGDHFGVLARAISEAVRTRPPEELTPYEALMRGFGYHFRLTPEEHAEARDVLERAVQQAPANADCQAMLAWVYAHEYAHDFNPRPGSLDRALAAALRAVDLAPSNHLAQQVLAAVYFFRKDLASCRSAAERALELNPMDGSNEAVFLIFFAGEYERGTRLIRRAMELNPHHPSWYRLILAIHEYHQGNYRGAVDELARANLGVHLWRGALLAAAYGQLGDSQAARAPLQEILVQKPDFAETGGGFFERWFAPQLVEHLMEGLRKAGLKAG